MRSVRIKIDRSRKKQSEIIPSCFVCEFSHIIVPQFKDNMIS